MSCCVPARRFTACWRLAKRQRMARFQGIGCSVAAFFLSNAAIAKIGVNKTSSFIGVSTIVSILAGALALGEPLSVGQIVGAAVIVAGVYTANASAS